MGQDNAKLSKRNGEVSIAWYREQGYLPEAICNYLALLGWSPGDDRENITMQELTELFTVEKVHSSPARFDMKKLEAINGDKIRALTIDDFATWTIPFLTRAQVITGTDAEIALVKQALPLIQERIVKLDEAPQLLKFLFVKEFSIEADALSKVTDGGAKEILERAHKDLTALANWSHENIEAALRASLIEEMGLKPRIAFTALRVATTGSTISPPLFESMELLGKDESLARIAKALSL